ncbi:MAG: InlB B-repeat-containing protein, partial [Eggerthellaceae bacterium]|nr:InlB B-repeat-containing protein [Eggerthellaceae bacterium]
VGELIFDADGKAKSIYIYGNTIPIPLDTLDGMVTVALCNDPSLGKAATIDTFMLEKTNATLVKDSISNLGITDIEVKLAISDMYDVQHEVKPQMSFDPAGGQWEDGTSAVKKYEPALETEFDIIDAPTRDGYTFECWEGSEYQPGEQYHADSDHVFTARWKKNDSGAGDGTASGDDASGGAKSAQTKSSPSKVSNTGDLLNPVLLLLAVLASGGTVAVAAKKRKREL